MFDKKAWMREYMKSYRKSHKTTDQSNGKTDKTVSIEQMAKIVAQFDDALRKLSGRIRKLEELIHED